MQLCISLLVILSAGLIFKKVISKSKNPPEVVERGVVVGNTKVIFITGAEQTKNQERLLKSAPLG